MYAGVCLACEQGGREATTGNASAVRRLGYAPQEKNLKMIADGRKRHIFHSLDRTQLILTSILLSFSQNLIIHDS